MEEQNYDELNLLSFEGVRKFKSVRRAIRRGNMTPQGLVPPRRPFNNRSRKKGSRPLEEEKEIIYGRLKHRRYSQSQQ